MALTNAERQAAFKARRAETLEALAQQNAALLAEVAELRALKAACRSAFVSAMFDNSVSVSRGTS